MTRSALIVPFVVWVGMIGAARVCAQESAIADDAAALDRIALGHFTGGRLALAEDAARRAIALHPDYAPPYNTLGLVQLGSGDPASARDSFVRARELDPTLFAAHMNEGALALDVRDFEAAEIAFLRGIELRPRDYDAWISLGLARRGLNDTLGAFAAYERARSIEPARPDAYFNLGVLQHLYGDESERTLSLASHNYEEFIRRAGNRPEYAQRVERVVRRCPVELRAQRRRRWQGPLCELGLLQDIARANRLGEPPAFRRALERIQAEADARARAEDVR
jgi:tetratricopeptide (TPR) repeat protein